MKLIQLRLLKTLLANGMNVSRAAGQHFVVQSAVSRQLNLLEEELGLPLFERKGKRLVEPTPVCRDMEKELDTIEQALENIRALADEYRMEASGEVRIATTHTQAKYFLPDVLQEFRQSYPRIAIHLLQGSPSQLVSMLLEGKADIAICTEEIGVAPGLLSERCYDWNHALVLPKGHGLTEGEITLERVAEYPLLTYVFGFTGRSKLHETFKEKGLEMNVSFAATDTDVILSYVRLGFGAGLIAKMAYSPQRDYDLVLRDLSGYFPASVTRIAWAKNKYLKTYLKDLIDLLLDYGHRDDWYP